MVRWSVGVGRDGVNAHVESEMHAVRYISKEIKGSSILK